jgi:hypothetical protein
MTEAQRIAVASMLRVLDPMFGHHGDCVGADADFDALCRAHHIDRIIHPPTMDVHRAWCGDDAFDVHDPADYHQRNRDIVRMSQVMIATPFEAEPQKRGGTWHTIRFARDQGVDLYVVLPGGHVL